MKYGVITRVAEPRNGGNLAAALNVYRCVPGREDANHGLGEWEPLGIAALALRVPVFTVGEILILNEDGREIIGAQRKPNKWDVDCTTFETLDAAIDCAQRITT